MQDLRDKEPEFRDEVKNKKNDMTGVVIAKYPGKDPGTQLLDIRGANDRIYYGTPAKIWEVVRLNNE